MFPLSARLRLARREIRKRIVRAERTRDRAILQTRHLRDSIGSQIKCAKCGKTFIKRSPTHRFCSASCRRTTYESTSEYRLNKKKVERWVTRPVVGALFDDSHMTMTCGFCERDFTRMRGERTLFCERCRKAYSYSKLMAMIKQRTIIDLTKSKVEEFMTKAGSIENYVEFRQALFSWLDENYPKTKLS